MAPLGRLRIICFFLTLTFVPVHVAAQGKLALYLDYWCHTPSQLLPSTSLPLSICLVPIGAVSIAIQQFPACENGSANMIMYEDTSCGRNTFGNTGTYTGSSDVTNCFYLYISKSVPGIMFTCDEPATNPQPTSTSTITASLVAGVATGAASTASKATSALTVNAGATTASQGTGTSSTSTAVPTIGNESTGGESSGSGSSSSSSSSSSFSHLGTSDKIAIGVGLGVGIPSIVIALLAWCLPRR